MSHAILSASASGRWIACTPSARLEANEPDTTSDFAEEGTLAHSLAELMLKKQLARIKKFQYEVELDRIKKHRLYAPEMYEHCSNYVVFVLEIYEEQKRLSDHVSIELEKKLDMSTYIEKGFGTVDVKITGDTTIDVIDLKYGKGVPVNAENNSQLMLYALAAVEEAELLTRVYQVNITIYQPRIDNFSTWTISVLKLKKWAEEILKPAATLAFKGEGNFVAGTHCRFCRIAGKCKANAAFNLQIAKHDFKPVEFLSDEDISDVLDRAGNFKRWIEAVQEEALAQAVRGKNWPGYKLVEGRGKRIYTDEAVIKDVLTTQGGFKLSQVAPRSLLGITEMENTIGKKLFSSLLTNLVIKSTGKLTLVPLSDKRSAHSGLEDAQNDFL